MQQKQINNFLDSLIIELNNLLEEEKQREQETTKQTAKNEIKRNITAEAEPTTTKEIIILKNLIIAINQTTAKNKINFTIDIKTEQENINFLEVSEAQAEAKETKEIIKRTLQGFLKMIFKDKILKYKFNFNF